MAPAPISTATPIPTSSPSLVPSQVSSEVATVSAQEPLTIPAPQQPVQVMASMAPGLTFHQMEQKHQEQIWEAQRQVENAASTTPPANDGFSLEAIDMTASMIAKQRITTEEEAKAALAERRRIAREQAEREAELERQRLVSTAGKILKTSLVFYCGTEIKSGLSFCVGG